MMTVIKCESNKPLQNVVTDKKTYSIFIWRENLETGETESVNRILTDDEGIVDQKKVEIDNLQYNFRFNYFMNIFKAKELVYSC